MVQEIIPRLYNQEVREYLISILPLVDKLIQKIGTSCGRFEDINVYIQYNIKRLRDAMCTCTC